MRSLIRILQSSALLACALTLFSPQVNATRVKQGSSYGTENSLTPVVFSTPQDFDEQELGVSGGTLFLFQINTSIDDFSLLLSSIDQFAYWGVLQQEPTDCGSDPNCPSFQASNAFYTGSANPCFNGTGIGQSADPGTFNDANPQNSITFTATGVANCTSNTQGSLTFFLLDQTMDPNNPENFLAAPVSATLTEGSGTVTTPEPSSLALLLVGVFGSFLVFYLAQGKANYRTAAI